MTSGGANSSQRVLRLSPSASLLRRSAHELQFGLDATRAGIVETLPGRARELGEVLEQPATHQQLAQRIQHVGYSLSEAYGLIDDLLVHGILRPTPREGPVVLVGELAGIGRILRRELRGRIRTRAKDSAALIESASADTPIVVLAPHETPELVPLLATKSTVFPVQSIDGAGVIGPLRLRGHGPCILCADLLRTAGDPLWARLRKATSAAGLEAPARLATAAALLALIRGLEIPNPSPGQSGVMPTPGLELVCNGFKVCHRVVEQYSLCPLCWAQKA
ncbi:hypothetical protein [Corynebacterium pseudopelargi]|uniref:Bacteriocin biosynthesis cyclodehydratase domain protein n=1 Tax=Corynebacterium pseudopelargi TaxID=2080757 RepID=A0A3G6J0X9_9CORY|nr:hypothetical protein [Corynebacterium pseudopelargi]AZA09794.1 hypothetical protein CPPEL_08455 [Corynebacterium pseudopelargi]